jgi:putative addiction module component (TIGR02574 family)
VCVVQVRCGGVSVDEDRQAPLKVRGVEPIRVHRRSSSSTKIDGPIEATSEDGGHRVPKRVSVDEDRRHTGGLIAGVARSPGSRYDCSMTGRAHKVLEDALTLSDEERLDLAEQLLSSLPAEPEWRAELERRARRALSDPGGGEAWEVVERRLAARIANR